MEELLLELKDKGIDISIDGQNLKLNIPDGINATETLEKVKTNKSGLIQYISRRKSSGKSHVQIKRAVERPYYRLSPAQKRLYFLHQLDTTSVAYNLIQMIRLKGDLNTEKVHKVFVQLIARHESLRTVFDSKDNEYVQRILENVPFNIEIFDSSEEKLDSLVKDFVQPFDLDKGPLMRVGIVEISPLDHILMVDMHHIITDGISQGIMFNEFIVLYNTKKLPELNLQYKDYSEWHHHEAQRKVIEDKKTFWIKEFTDGPQAINLPSDFPRPSTLSDEGGKVDFELDAITTDHLNSLAIKQSTTLYMVLLSIFNALLSKLSNQEDIVVGTPVGGRQHAQLEGVIGMFVNTLPLRFSVDNKLTFNQLLAKVNAKGRECFENQAYPYEELIEELRIPRETSRNPLFDTMFVFQNFQNYELESNGLHFERYNSDHRLSRLDLTLNVVEMENHLSMSIDYSAALFKKTTIERFIRYFKRMVSDIIDNGDCSIFELDILSIEERHQLLSEFNDTKVEFPKTKTVIDLFEANADKYPEERALIFEGQEVSYGSFNEKVNQMTMVLLDKGIKQGDIVGIMSPRSIELMVGIFAIVKAGAAYLPIDPGYPEARIKYILEDSGACLLLLASEFRARVTSSVEQIDSNSSRQPLQAGVKVKSNATPDGVAYVIYTSGSTGQPKGVMVEHKALMNRLQWMGNTYTIGKDDIVLQKTPIVFDVSVWELFWWSQQGASLCLLSPGEEKDPGAIAKTIAQYGITTMHFVPSMLQIFLEHLEIQKDYSGLHSLKQVFASGEALKPNLVSIFNKLLYGNFQARLINLYGPTEATIDVSYFNCTDHNGNQIVPIGKPIDNINLYVLNKANNIQPIGVPGELGIAGVGLAKGYLNKEELTKERFIQHPFSKEERLYMTGDLARWLPDGNIEYLGRIDDQVKIRGFRIELGEIETVLVSHPEVKGAVVVVGEDEGEKDIIGYYVSKLELNQTELRLYLQEQLPEYMVPSFYIHLEELPLTINGKIDKKSLPIPEFVSGQDYVAPSEEIEYKLVRIWSEILKIDEELIGVNENFFEIGGHSLKANLLVNRISEELNVSVPLNAIFSHQNIKSLSHLIQRSNDSSRVKIQRASKKEYYPLSSAQLRLYFIYELDKTSLTYNLPYTVSLEGTLDESKLAAAFDKLISRHESLRTTFSLAENEVVQKICESVEFKIEHYEVSTFEVHDTLTQFIRPFDLSKTPLFRVGLITTAPNAHILMMDMHHIICDGVSQGVLLKDFMALYQGDEILPLPVQYRDYAVWTQGQEQKNVLAAQREFWLQKFEEEVSVLELPTDFVRPPIKEEGCANFQFNLDAKYTDGLRTIGEKVGATMFMTLLSVLNVLLSKLSNQEDIIVGTPVAGRNNSDLESVVGMFVNTLALRNYPKGNLSFEDFLSEVKGKTAACFGNQSFPLEELIEALGLTGDMSRNPLFDVMFAFQNFELEELTIPGVSIKPFNNGHIRSRFDLLITATPAGDELYFDVEYATSLFTKPTIERIVKYFKSIVQMVVEDASCKLSQLDILSSAERDQLLNQFNDTALDIPTNKTIVGLIEEQVQLNPDKVALIFNGIELSYHSFHQKVNKMATLLLNKGIQRGDIVGIMCHHSIDLMVGIFGVMKTGAAYLPIDPNYPDGRINYVLSDSHTNLLLTLPEFESKITGAVETLDLKEMMESQIDDIELESKAIPEDLAYVIYTSGSTGHPKGVKISHLNVLNFIEGITSNIEFAQDSRILALTTISFDIFVLEAVLPLTKGLCVVLSSEAEQMDPVLLNELIQEQQVDMLQFTPSRLQLMLSYDNELASINKVNTLMIGGEAFPENLLEEVKEKYKGLIYNMYGPSETTVWSMIRNLTNDTRVTIGKPIANTSIHILGSQAELLPLGVAGELCIGGMGLAKGYVNNKQLTDEKFIPVDFKKGEKVYRTGDLAKWLPDGNIDFLGRIDHQVKIRGFRIELGEIESLMANYEEIKEVVVVAKEKEGDKHLVAYYIAQEELVPAELRAYLAEKLPDYMLPAYYVHLENLPLTANGKIDRKSLPEPKHEAGDDYEGPSNEVETQLVEIWSDVLKVDKDIISINKSFFELGGNSLKSVLLINQINKVLNIEFRVKDLFAKQNIKSLAEFIQINNWLFVEELDDDEGAEFTI